MKPIRHLFAAATLLGATALASATPIFVGQWDLYSGVDWQGMPLVLSGQDAAAKLFGGKPSDYVISTAGTAVADIDYMAWYDQYGFADEQLKLSQSHYNDTDNNGLYDNWYDTSAMVKDHPYKGSGPYPYVNYAFRIEQDTAVPEPLSVGLMGAGLLGLALARRRRS